MNDHRFILQPYKGFRTRYTCPVCERRGEFARYVDTKKRYTFPDHVGRCNRESSCGYHYTPKQFFDDNPEERTSEGRISSVWNAPPMNKQPEKQTDYFDERVMLSTMAGYGRNSFTNALRTVFDSRQVENIIERYRLGTTKSGAVIFWQVDTLGRIRYGKAMHYLPNLHRDKSKHPVGVHSLMGKYDFNHRQCFFGEHLLSIPENRFKPAAIIESEKSACICSEMIPDYIWLATGGKSGLKWNDKNVWAYLEGHRVILFPDADAHQQWTEKAELFRSFGIQVSIYDGLYKIAPGTQQDIADHLIIDLMRKRSEENSAANTDAASTPVDPAVSAMTAENPCEVTRMLSGDELMRLAAGLPDHDSFTESELCRMLHISPANVLELIEREQVYFISIAGRYCRVGCTPF